MTLKDIAKEAGVSVMTVSNVVNGRTDKVSESTRTRVESIIKQFNYKPNLSARSLIKRSSNLIGIVLPIQEDEHGDDYNVFNNPYISLLVGIIERELRERGYYVILRSVKSKDDLHSLIQNWNVAGAIFVIPEFERMVNELVEDNPFPLVFFDSYVENPNVLSVRVNDYKGAYLAANYLVSQGHRNIGFVGNYKKHHVMGQRYKGVKDALAKNAITFNENWIFEEPGTYAAGLRIGQEIADHHQDITGLVVTSDLCALGVLEGARLGGLKIPYDLSIIGFDNLDIATYSTPKLTTVNQNISAKAEEAAKLLIAKIEDTPIESRHITIDVEIVERQSVAFL